MVIVRYKYIFCIYYIIERSKKKEREVSYTKKKSRYLYLHFKKLCVLVINFLFVFYLAWCVPFFFFILLIFFNYFFWRFFTYGFNN